ncbi:N-acetyltransferase [Luedemannella helvata]|uniref:N-acetyltransferase n=1 Tax=Luedemannella helvata TaxID=349315 RepID=UPI0031D2EC89
MTGPHPRVPADAAPRVAPGSAVWPDVVLGAGSVVEEFCLVGRPAGDGAAPVPTVLGPGARVRSHTVIYAGVRAGRGFATGHHVLVREDTALGDDVSIGSLSVVEHHVTVGHGVRVHSHCFVPEYSVLEDGAWLGPRVTVTNAPRPRCPDVSACLAGVRVGRDARVGANVTVLPGVRIGAGALIGAGAVVTRDVPAGSVAVGVPARTVGEVDQLSCPAGLDHLPYPPRREDADVHSAR